MSYGDEAFAALQEHYTKEIKNAYAKGKREAIEGLSSSPINKGTNTEPRKQDGPKIQKLEDLYND
jgi:hypothetical protein